MKATEYKNYITDLFVKAISNGVEKWHREWSTMNVGQCNMTTGSVYQGINKVVLMLSAMEKGFHDHRWMTFKQAEKIGAKVKKGSKGTYVRKLITEKKNSEGEIEELDSPFYMTYVVFNFEQFENIDETKIKVTQRPQKVEKTIERNQKIEKLLANTHAKIEFLEQNHAFYRPSTDSIVIPTIEQFESVEGYYSTIFHELSHWTGAETRLNRDMSGRFGNESYAKEELIAEISAFMLCLEFGMNKISNHASYVANWQETIANKGENTIRDAVRLAFESKQYIMKFK